MRFRREVLAWWHAVLRCLPGRIGESVRNFCAGYRGAPGVRVLQGVIIYCPEKLSIGRNSAITAGCQLNARGGITIGEDVLIGPGTFIWSQNHRFADPETAIRLQGYDRAPVVIEDDVWIAARCVILPGVTIGRGSVVAAGSVVTKAVPPGTLVAGVPAKRIGEREPGVPSAAQDEPGELTDVRASREQA